MISDRHYSERARRIVSNGDVSYWHSSIGLPRCRDALSGDREADVCIVGAGLTGLWTAYYLLGRRPDLRVVLVEREFAGFGASGRNGGWLSDRLAGPRERYALSGGRGAVVDLLNAMRGAIDEVVRVCGVEGIDADIVKDGVLYVARNAAQERRLREVVEYERSWGTAPDDLQLLSPSEAQKRVVVSGTRAALYSPHCARVHPAKLVRGLADVVERRGGRIYERTAVRQIDPGAVQTSLGAVVRAPVVLRCLEGYSASIRGERRRWLPMSSSMIATEPLSDDDVQRLRWTGAELLGDFAHGHTYAQRTADGRIALGGKGVPYRFGSRTDSRGRTDRSTIMKLSRLLQDMFPEVDLEIAHAWCGVLGVPRDWCATVSFDRFSGLGVAGGYVGSGLTTTNLAGRTMADLVMQQDSDLTKLPWVGRSGRRWEPEPLRWLGAHTAYALYRAADRSEYDNDHARTSRFATVANWLTGSANR